MSTFVFPRQFYNDEIGRTLPLSRLYFYETGTYNDKQVFSDKALTTPMSQPVVADGSGRFPPIYLNTDTSYRVQLKDRLDQDIGTYIDGVEPYIYPSSLGTAAYVDTGTDSGDVPLNSDLGTSAYVNTGTGGSEIPTNDDLGAQSTFTPAFSSSAGVTITVGAGQTYAAYYTVYKDIVFIEVDFNFDDSGSSVAVGNRFELSGIPVSIRPNIGTTSGAFSVGSATLHSSSSNRAIFDVSANSSNSIITFQCIDLLGSVNYATNCVARLSYRI